MTSILVSGLINIETTLRVDGFPLAYFPVTYPFHGIGSSASGVGFNLAKALTTLGDRAVFLSLIGQDFSGEQSRGALRQAGVDDRYVLGTLEQTAQSVILYEPSGRRQIHVDLKDIQEQVYPTGLFAEAAAGCELLALCNINFSRALLTLAQTMGKPVATDVHALVSLEDDYNRDFMAAANILFLSHEALPAAPKAFAKQIFNRYGAEIVVIGMGADGALLGVRAGQHFTHFPAVSGAKIVNSIGAGDALFSAFLHDYVRTHDPYLALEKAMVFAAHKIGAASAAEGFLSDPELEARWAELHKGNPVYTSLI